jgi:transcriptional regulator with XRE-family HTH domain
MPSSEAVAAAVARNTRRLRTERGWSLDQFAQRSGVSKGMLVQLEQARTNPSLGTLCKLAETLGVSLAGLVELHETPVVRVVTAADTVRLWASEAGSSGDLLVGTDDRDHGYANRGRRPVHLVMVVLQPDADLDEWTADAAPGSPA